VRIEDPERCYTWTVANWTLLGPRWGAFSNRAVVLHLVLMAAKETTLKELGEMLGHVVEHMATKEDIANLGGQLTSIERELKSIRRLELQVFLILI
jgi:hypothetical protein